MVLPWYRLLRLYYFIPFPLIINLDINSAGGWCIDGRVVRAYHGRLLVRRWCGILVLIIGGDGGGGWPLCNCNKERIDSGTFDDSGMQIYASRFAYGTVRRCVIKVGRWYADACEWISKSSQPPQFVIYVEWCGDGSLRLESSPYLGYMRLETLLWFIIMIYHMILFCGYELDSSTWWQACMLFRIVDNIHAALVCQTKNLHYTCYIGIIITKSTHFDYHLRVSEVRC